MKYFAATLLLICWLAVTLVLAITVVGLIVILEEDRWMDFPDKLLAVFTK